MKLQHPSGGDAEIQLQGGGAGLVVWFFMKRVDKGFDNWFERFTGQKTSVSVPENKTVQTNQIKEGTSTTSSCGSSGAQWNVEHDGASVLTLGESDL